MIITALIYIFGAMANILSFILPAWTIPEVAMSGYDFFWNNLNLWSNYFPITATMNCLFIIFGYHTILIIIKLGSWFIGVVRGSGGSLQID